MSRLAGCRHGACIRIVWLGGFERTVRKILGIRVFPTRKENAKHQAGNRADAYDLPWIDVNVVVGRSASAARLCQRRVGQVGDAGPGRPQGLLRVGSRLADELSSLIAGRLEQLSRVGREHLHIDNQLAGRDSIIAHACRPFIRFHGGFPLPIRVVHFVQAVITPAAR